MINILDDGIQFLADQLKDWTAKTFTYKRRNPHDRSNPWLLELLATKTPIEFTEQKFDPTIGAFATVGRTQTWDFILETDDLLLIDGEPTTPRIGDQIIETTETERLTYEVATLGGEKEWRYVDQDRKLILLSG